MREKSGRSLMIDDPIVGPLVAGFVKKLPTRMASLHTAQERSDWCEVANQAHQMAGAAGGYGFPEIGKIAAQIEAQVKNHTNPASIARTMVAFNLMCRSAIHNHSQHH